MAESVGCPGLGAAREPWAEGRSLAVSGVISRNGWLCDLGLHLWMQEVSQVPSEGLELLEGEGRR